MKDTTRKNNPLINIGKNVYRVFTSPNERYRNMSDKPWLNDDGSLKDDQEIQVLGKGWSTKTWNNYLNATVDLGDEIERAIPFSEDEYYLKGIKLSNTLENLEYYPRLKKAFRVALDGLTKSEREVLLKYFWENKKTPVIAKELKKANSTVRVLKQRGINKLREILTSLEFKHKLAHLGLVKS